MLQNHGQIVKSTLESSSRGRTWRRAMRVASAVALGGLASLTAPAWAADVLSYWDFNNATAGTGLGTFNTTGTVEVYNPTDKSLTPATGGVFASSSFVYVAVADLLPQLQRRLPLSATAAQLGWIVAGLGLVMGVKGFAH